MNVWDLGPSVFAFERVSLRGHQRILAVHNVTGSQVRIDAEALRPDPPHDT